MITVHNQYLSPATKLGQGYIFTRVCDSVQRGVCLSALLGYPPPQEQTPGTPPWEQQTPPEADTPLGANTPPPCAADKTMEQTPPGSSACWEIQATSGRYTSYWNAFLCNKKFPAT